MHPLFLDRYIWWKVRHVANKVLDWKKRLRLGNGIFAYEFTIDSGQITLPETNIAHENPYVSL